MYTWAQILRGPSMYLGKVFVVKSDGDLVRIADEDGEGWVVPMICWCCSRAFG